MALTQQQREQNLAEAIKSAQDCQRAIGLWSSLTLAQWILESGWGEHAPGNNCFGIKYRQGRHVAFQLIWTHEVIPVGGLKDWQRNHPELQVIRQLNATQLLVKLQAKFAKYPSLGDCFKDHAYLLTQGIGYRAAWEAHREDHQPFAFIEAFARVYATDPDYAGKLRNLIESRGLLTHDVQAQQG